MVTLNLTDESKSQIKYQISKFPDGQQNWTLTGFWAKRSDEWSTSLSRFPVLIKSRLNSFKDLEIILCATQTLRRVGVRSISLFIPYLIGARSDRQFKKNENSYLVDVIAPILNSQNYETIEVMDIHSDVAAACIPNLVNVDNTKLVRFALDSLYGSNTPDNFVLVSPDGGSLKKVYHLADEIGFKDEILCCSKFRDTDGKLSKVHVPVRVDHFSKDIIIVDDICDGGRTFVNIAREFTLAQPERTGTMHLIVTHGIFSNGIAELGTYFDKIYCTNSVADISKDKFGNDTTGLIKQLNVF